MDFSHTEWGQGEKFIVPGKREDLMHVFGKWGQRAQQLIDVSLLGLRRLC